MTYAEFKTAVTTGCNYEMTDSNLDIWTDDHKGVTLNLSKLSEEEYNRIKK